MHTVSVVYRLLPFAVYPFDILVFNLSRENPERKNAFSTCCSRYFYECQTKFFF
jgi:hypothetical protein